MRQQLYLVFPHHAFLHPPISFTHPFPSPTHFLHPLISFTHPFPSPIYFLHPPTSSTHPLPSLIDFQHTQMVNFRITSQLRDAKEDLASRNFSSLSTPQTQRWQKVVELYNEDFAESSSYQSESRRQRRKQARVCLSKVAKDFGQEAAFLCAIAIPITTLGSQRGVVHSVIEAQHITDDNPPSFSALAESRFSLLQPSLGPAKSKPIYQSAVSTTSYPRKRSFPSEHPVETLPPTLRQKSADGQQVEHADSGSPVASAVERESDQDSTDDESDSEADGEKRADVCQQSSREITKDKPMSLFTSQLPGR
ncbi:hypothetical protein EV126DRAFT_176554 [Verticillium dahliae]|nr:hypothetical protein EV126DRAFT_176554 [Verticillium dahliae]